MSVPAGVSVVALFIAIYGAALAISITLQMKAGEAMRRDAAGLLELRTARLPLAAAGLGLGIGVMTGALPMLSALAAFAFCALSCGVADTHAWAVTTGRAQP